MQWEGRRLRDDGAELHDLSAAGAFVRTPTLPVLGDAALLLFRCGAVQCSAAGEVVDVRPGHGFAIAFTATTSSFDQLLRELDSVSEDVSRDLLQVIADAELAIGGDEDAW